MLNVRPPQKVNPSVLPHAPLTESISDSVTVDGSSPLNTLSDVVLGFVALSL